MSDTLARGELVRLVYRLGLSRATGVLIVEPARGASEALVLRRGCLVGADGVERDRGAAQRLERLAAMERSSYRFDGGAAAYPPGAAERQLSLVTWARRHLERQIDSTRAQLLVSELAGTRLVLRTDLAPPAELCDETDQRILEAMRVPRRLDQIWPLARTPRFRLLTFIHFLRRVGALELEGIAAPAPYFGAPQLEARRRLGVDARADKETVKRAYRRLARALHPDLHPSANAERRRLLALKFSEINQAYRQLVGPE